MYRIYILIVLLVGTVAGFLASYKLENLEIIYLKQAIECLLEEESKENAEYLGMALETYCIYVLSREDNNE